MFSQSIIRMCLLIALLGYGFGWVWYNWQWWAVVIPSILAFSLIEAIEAEIRGWYRKSSLIEAIKAEMREWYQRRRK